VINSRIHRQTRTHGEEKRPETKEIFGHCSFGEKNEGEENNFQECQSFCVISSSTYCMKFDDELRK